MPFVTPRNISTLQLSRIDYNNSLVALLQNFASPNTPQASDVTVEGVIGLKPGMLWYKAGSNTTLGQGRLLIYTGTSFTRDGIATLTFPTLNSANAAVAGGHINEGELLLIDGDKKLYRVYQNQVTAVSSDDSAQAENANTLNYLTSAQFMRSDVDQVFTGALTGNKMVTLSNATVNSKTVGALRLSGATGTILIDNDGSKRITWNDAIGRSFGMMSGVYYNAGERYTNTGSGAGAIIVNNDAAHGQIYFKVANIGTSESPIPWTQTMLLSNTGLSLNSNTVWHAGNDGPGSGLDADTLDGKQLTTIENEYKANDAATLLTARSNDYSTYTTLSGMIANVSAGANNSLSLKANIASPTFTGVPAGPTAAAATNTTQLATTAFVHAAINNDVTKAKIDGLNVNAGSVGGVAIGNIVRKDTDSVVSANVSFADNKQIRIGTGNDTVIYHNGTDTFIDHEVVGNLFIRNKRIGGEISIDAANATGSIKNAIKVTNATSAVELSFEGNKRFETTKDGIKIHGSVEADGIHFDGSDFTKVSDQLDTTPGRYLTVGYGGIGQYIDFRTGSKDAWQPHQWYSQGLRNGFAGLVAAGYPDTTGTYGAMLVLGNYQSDVGKAALARVMFAQGKVGVQTATDANTWGTWNVMVPDTRAFSAGDGLSGGGNLTANRSFAVDSSVLRTTRTVIAGNGLTGGGALSSNISFAVGKGDGIAVNAANVAVDSTVVRITRLVNSGDGLSGGGNLSTNRTLTVDGTVVRTTRTISAGDGLSGGGAFSSNVSLAVDGTVVRTTRTITAGNGLTGGGALTGNVTLNVDNTVVRTTRTVSAGNGLTGGGALTGNVSFAVGAGDGITVNASNVAVDNSVVRTSGNQNIAGAKNFSSPVETKERIIINVASGSVGPKELFHDTSGNIGFYDRGASSWRLQVSAAGIVSSAGNRFAGSADTLTNARTIKIGATGKTFNGSSNITWTLPELGLGTAATRDTGTASGQVPLNSDLGTAATKNVGTAPGEVPLNSDLPKPHYEVFTASGTWTKPPGLDGDRVVIIEVWAGGGGGARVSGTNIAWGGGGGGYNEARLRVSDLPSSVAVTVGAGGSGRKSSTGAGTNGGSSTFGSLVEAAGGEGGNTIEEYPSVGGHPGKVFGSELGYGVLFGGGSYGSFHDGSLTFLPTFPSLWGGGGGDCGIFGIGMAATFGGGGGGGSGDTIGSLGGPSVFGGSGGASNRSGGPVNGVAPGGGGAGCNNNVNGGDGARGEVRVTIL